LAGSQNITSRYLEIKELPQTLVLPANPSLARKSLARTLHASLSSRRRRSLALHQNHREEESSIENATTRLLSQEGMLSLGAFVGQEQSVILID
jgi:hypothetical protein